MHRHHAWLLFIGLMLLLLANTWLFLPRYVLDRQKMTADDLRGQMEQLQAVAQDGASVLSNLASDPSSTTALQSLEVVQQRADDIVVALQHAPYEVSLDDEVHERLELAQVVSFTLHDASFRTKDALTMSRTSQVLSKAAVSADALGRSDSRLY
jgi:hypothetical protein